MSIPMGKFKYTNEFEVKASLKMLYPYFSTPVGLKEWFADDVNVSPDKDYVFEWSGDKRPAKIVAKRTNHYIKFQFEPPKEGKRRDAAYVEFKMDYNEMTQSTFVSIVDYSDMDDVEELDDLWTHFFIELKTKVGA